MPAPDVKLLENAFNEFSRASDSIISYYGILESRIRQLTKEVEEKNAELEKAGDYLNNILDSLPVGVVVLDRKSVIFQNKNAARLTTGGIVPHLNVNGEKIGEIKNSKGYFRWKKERLTNGFEGKEVIVIEDVTEVEKMKERSERDERLRAMGEMAARIAHEIKNPLGSMELFLSMIQGNRLKTKEKKYVDYVLFGLKTIDRIINNILSYTRPKTLVLKEEKLFKIVSDTLDFMSVSIMGRAIEVEFNASYREPSLFDPDLVKLVIMNLISNAIDAVNEKGTIRIEIREEGNYVLLVVSDNGVGMSEDVRRNIFNPFFTMKDKGVGLGLYIVYNIVQAHGGFIEAESAEGSGSSFFMYIPKDRQ
ncbi:MAG: ATP-binding protein [Syntrophorhabdaceae bacterium]|jgi:two-component system sensor histidine kinase FlrB|nr:ATP-binding protein [Syntrophorhabdaceae bacterium]MDD5243908.1 ATP-binding protein [Syntrophorhabdaceae bacterium]